MFRFDISKFNLHGLMVGFSVVTLLAQPHDATECNKMALLVVGEFIFSNTQKRFLMLAGIDGIASTVFEDACHEIFSVILRSGSHKSTNENEQKTTSTPF